MCWHSGKGGSRKSTFLPRPLASILPLPPTHPSLIEHLLCLGPCPSCWKRGEPEHLCGRGANGAPLGWKDPQGSSGQVEHMSQATCQDKRASELTSPTARHRHQGSRIHVRPCAHHAPGHSRPSQALPEPLGASCLLPSHYPTRLSACTADKTHPYHSQANCKCYLLKHFGCEMSCKLIGF